MLVQVVTRVPFPDKHQYTRPRPVSYYRVLKGACVTRPPLVMGQLCVVLVVVITATYAKTANGSGEHVFQMQQMYVIGFPGVQ